MPARQVIQLEFLIHSSPKILFNFLSTAQGLADWFADNVNISNGIYEFKWGDETAYARIGHKRDGKLIEFIWLYKTENNSLRFEIQKAELTNDVSLLVTDYCLPEDEEETRRLWDAQINDLKRIIGS